MNVERKTNQPHDEVQQLKRAIEELSVLNDLARAISVVQDQDEIMRTISKRSIKAIRAEQVSITLVDREAMVPTGTLVREVGSDVSEIYHLNRHLLGCMCHERRALLVNDPDNDERLKGIPIDAGVRNFICVPLMVGAELIGVLSAYNKIGDEGFDPDDQRLLAIIASQSAQVLERARIQIENRANVDNLRAAEKIQMGLLPQEQPDIAGYDVAGDTLAAGHVGGDYYDFIPLKDKRWAIALGDVSGKGLPAALLMATLQATLRSLALQGTSCHQSTTDCNHLLYLSTTPDKFATLFYSRLDTRSNVLTYCNAGHERPLYLTSSGRTKRLTSGGLAAGVLEHFDYEDDIVILQPGETVVIFSDGVTDMENSAEEPFGEDRLVQLVEANRDCTATELVQRIIDEVRDHAGGAERFDDVTVVVIKRNP
jgi:serine phosphatase RsbU (regulator of sigma subunit)